jgi:hypothetical protein
MEYVIAGMQWEICLVYLDDILIFSRTLYEHLARLQTVFFPRIKLAGLKISHQTCYLFHREVKFLEHIVNITDILPDPSQIEAISTWPVQLA